MMSNSETIHSSSYPYNQGGGIRYIEDRHFGSLGKQKKFQTIAIMEAYKSPCIQKHGALITRGNVIYAKGYNTNQRTIFLGKQDFCMHAEMFVANSFINQYIRRKPRLRNELQHFTVWCVRIPGDHTRAMNGHTAYSAPCNICINRMKEFGFGRIAFSDQCGSIQVWNLRDTHQNYLTHSQRKTMHLIKI